MKYSALYNKLKKEAALVEIGTINDVIVSLEEFEEATVHIHNSSIGEDNKIAYVQALAKETFLEIFSTIRANDPVNVDTLADVLGKKNKDYGNSFDKVVDKFGDVAMSIRISDKLSRIKNLVNANTTVLVKGESVGDTLLDTLGYLLLIQNYGQS